ncbi:hypothetical protein [Halorussus lipolyticus]|uniref:hypothetical protein n=1 Tax=Halorussus lipolyticus TaxID=3034024 RepID=UPI0023E762B1|nr:hypothetical protein [Halorussus sp. DT80]
MERLTSTVVAAFLLGLVVGAVGGFAFGGQLGLLDPGPTNSGPNPESPPYSLSKSGGCLDVRPHAGWVHEVAVGDSFAVTLNATVVHDRGATVSTNVSRVAPGAYRIDLRTVSSETVESDANRTKSPPEDCRVATDLRLGASLPTDYREVEVALDGRTLLTVENEDTAPDLYQLPNPVNATVSAN